MGDDKSVATIDTTAQNDEALRHELVSQNVYIVKKGSKCLLLCWLLPETYSFLHNPDNIETAQSWLSGVQVHEDSFRDSEKSNGCRRSGKSIAIRELPSYAPHQSEREDDDNE